MVKLALFENSSKSQAIRTLLAFAIIIPLDLFYLFVSERNIGRFMNNKMAYINVWVTLALVFGVSILSSDSPDSQKQIQVKDYAQYGLLIGLLVYVPLYNWIISCGAITKFTQLTSISNTGFGVVLSSITCISVYLISIKLDILN